MTPPFSGVGGGRGPAHSHSARHQLLLGTSSIGSFLDESGEAVIVLGGAIDTATVEQLGAHIEDLLDARIRFLTVAAAAVTSNTPELLELLGHTQHQLGLRHGLLRVRGLHPSLLRDTADPATPPTPERVDPSSRPPSDDGTLRVADPERLQHVPEHRSPEPEVSMSVTIEMLATELHTDPDTIIDAARQMIESGPEKVLTVGHPTDDTAPVTCLTDHAASTIRARLGTT